MVKQIMNLLSFRGVKSINKHRESILEKQDVSDLKNKIKNFVKKYPEYEDLKIWIDIIKNYNDIELFKKQIKKLWKITKNQNQKKKLLELIK